MPFPPLWLSLHLCLGSLALATAAHGQAQDPPSPSERPPVEAGTLIRVTKGDGPPLSGTVIGWTADTLVMDPEGSNAHLSLPRDSLTSLEVGVRQSGAGRGARKGLFIGAAIGGGIFLYALVASSGDDDAGDALAWGLMSTLVYGGLGAGIGALVGAGSGQTTWVPIPTEGIRATPTYADGRVGVRLSLPVR